MRNVLQPSVRAFSIIEIIVAFCLIIIGFFTFFTVFSTSSQYAVQTQNRAAANILAQGYLDDFRTHIFGSPAPASWARPEERPIRMVIKDRETHFVFHKAITYETGAFVDGTKGDRDKITLIISWRELAGDNQVASLPASYPYRDDNKMLKVEVPAWR